MKFICDEMLGSLAKWIRILGYDAKYVKGVEDDDIIEIARKEGRILLTRDKILASKCENSIYLENNGLRKQLEKVIKETGMEIRREKWLTRCIICNEKIIKLDKKEAKGKVPERIYEMHDEFFICPKCHRIYWLGTHFDNMEKFLNELKINIA